MKPPAAYTVRPFPPERQLTIEGGQLAVRKHTVTALIEADVTLARRRLRAQAAQTGVALSFTAFILACLGRAVNADRALHAYRDWRGRLVIFDDVDVNISVEIDHEGRKKVLPHIIRGANTRAVRDLHDEIRAVQARPAATRSLRMAWFVRLPRWARQVFYWYIFRNPAALKEGFGTVGLTAVGMFGQGGGWAIPFGVHTLDVGVGGIARRPALEPDGGLAQHEYLCLTLLFDHDVVDGAPAARFTERLRELIESAYGLAEYPGEDSAATPPSTRAGVSAA
ncbi:MAG: 2-oxo acid dehydrogenase subunit E2 [Anaerolineales bacterium]|nr:2-oxo acid dehydrogenase subunit E2 [Anaerolineales bacterium]